VLSVQSLTRRFGETVALDDVSFDVVPGRVTGFVGPNGAGKTTAMRIILGVLAPTSGQVGWRGEPLTAVERRSFGYMPEERGLYPKMKVTDQLVYFARLHGVPVGEARERAERLLARLELGDKGDHVLQTLSLGNQQRVQIAAALIHEPICLVLDEPFSGLDPVAVEAMVGLLRDEVSAQVPVLFSSHQLELVERICDDLVILSGGRLRAAGSAEELRDRGPTRYRVVLDDDQVYWLRGVDGVEDVAVADGAVLLQVADVEPAELLGQITARGRVREFARHRPALSEVFREVVR